MTLGTMLLVHNFAAGRLRMREWQKPQQYEDAKDREIYMSAKAPPRDSTRGNYDRFFDAATRFSML